MRFEFAYMCISFFPYSFGIETYTSVVPLKTIVHFSMKTHKNHTLWGDTYLYGLYKGLPTRPPPARRVFPSTSSLFQLTLSTYKTVHTTLKAPFQ